MAQSMDILIEEMNRTHRRLFSLSKQIFENHLNFGTKFDDEIKQQLKQISENILKCKHQLDIQQDRMYSLNEECQNIRQSLINNDEIGNNKIEEILEKWKMEMKTIEAEVNESIKQNPFQIGQDPDHRRLVLLVDGKDTINTNEQNDENDIEMMEQEFEIPIDPISRLEINIPVRNKICNHLYDKDNFINLFQVRRTKIIKCPVAACTNKKVTIDDIEEDSRLKILIVNAKRQQEEQNLDIID